jgi:molybdopterin-guanine dinucleotide biosynthesis protein A
LSAERAAIVLAGGQGARLGEGPPKALRAFGTSTLLDIALAKARAWADEVRVSAPAEMPLPLDESLIVRDHRAFGPRAGPLIALASSLGAIAAPWALALAVDLPFARRELFDLLWEARTRPATPNPSSPHHAEPLAVVPWTGRGPEPLLAVYRQEVAAILLAAAYDGERAVHRVIASLPTVRVGEDELRAADPELICFQNVNTPDDWREAEVRFRLR